MTTAQMIPQGVIVHQQRYRPSDNVVNKIKNCSTADSHRLSFFQQYFNNRKNDTEAIKRKRTNNVMVKKGKNTMINMTVIVVEPQRLIQT